MKIMRDNEQIKEENAIINENLQEFLSIGQIIPNEELDKMLQQVTYSDLTAISNLLAKAYGCPYKFSSPDECVQLKEGYQCNFDDQSICWNLAIEYNTLCNIFYSGLKFYKLDEEGEKLLRLFKNHDGNEELYNNTEQMVEFQKFLKRRKRMDLHFVEMEDEHNFNMLLKKGNDKAKTDLKILFGLLPNNNA